MVAKRVPVTRTVGGRTLTIRNVPALCCPLCDNILYKAQTVKTMDSLIRDNQSENALEYPDNWVRDLEVLRQLGIDDPLWMQDLSETARRYDLACLQNRIRQAMALAAH